MAKYLIRITYTTLGVNILQKNKATGLRAAGTKAIEAAGGKVESYYFAFGPDDVVGIVDFPDNVAAASVSLAANSVGNVRFSLTPLMTAEEMDRALEKSGSIPVPGR
jgi:uncharacterized protein with GYD domain